MSKQFTKTPHAISYMFKIRKRVFIVGVGWNREMRWGLTKNTYPMSGGSCGNCGIGKLWLMYGSWV